MIKNIETKVVHSQSKSAFNVIGTRPGQKYKIARVPYIPITENDPFDRNKIEALDHATFISYCFNNAELILNGFREPDYVKVESKMSDLNYLRNEIEPYARNYQAAELNVTRGELLAFVEAAIKNKQILNEK